jgi:peptidoglycan/xylan/chitin deacetylase (PgdA/CDA1 family)
MEKPSLRFEKAMLIFSIDIDVGDKKLGVMNHGQNDAHVNTHVSECQIGEVEEQGFLPILDTFNSFNVPVTFAVRGQLTELDYSFLPLLLNSPVKHDIGSHGYTHKKFQDLSRIEAEHELRLLDNGMKKHGITPRSFVFPRNAVAHLDLLEKFGYECYRAQGNFLNDGMLIQKKGLLYDVHPSLYLTKNAKFSVLKRLLDIATARSAPFHLWSHIWSFGNSRTEIQENIENMLVPFLEYAKSEENKHLLQFETMFSASSKARQLLESSPQVF